jgi:hypothetical protein
MTIYTFKSPRFDLEALHYAAEQALHSPPLRILSRSLGHGSYTFLAVILNVRYIHLI